MSALEAEAAAPADAGMEAAASMQKEARECMFDEPGRAVLLLGRALEAHVQAGRGNSVDCASVYMDYGMALLENARTTVDALGGEMRAAVDKRDGTAAPSGSKGARGGTLALRALTQDPAEV